MMKKKLFSIAMAALVVCGMAVLTGCGHDDEPTIPDSKGESGQTTTPTQKSRSRRFTPLNWLMPSLRWLPARW